MHARYVQFLFAGTFLDLVSLLLGTAGAGAYVLVPGVPGTILLLWGTVLAHKASTPFVFQFRETDWVSNPEGTRITVPLKKHKKGSAPIGKIELLRENGTWERVIADERVADRDYTLVADRPFAGRLTIR